LTTNAISVSQDGEILIRTGKLVHNRAIRVFVLFVEISVLLAKVLKSNCLDF
jgi:hypothetical protein